MISKEFITELLSGIANANDFQGDKGLMKELKDRLMERMLGAEQIRKGKTRIEGMDDKIIRLYAAGLLTRDIFTHLEEVYGLKMSAELISRVTDAVLE